MANLVSQANDYATLLAQVAALTARVSELTAALAEAAATALTLQAANERLVAELARCRQDWQECLKSEARQ